MGPGSPSQAPSDSPSDALGQNVLLPRLYGDRNLFLAATVGLNTQVIKATLPIPQEARIRQEEFCRVSPHKASESLSSATRSAFCVCAIWFATKIRVSGSATEPRTRQSPTNSVQCLRRAVAVTRQRWSPSKGVDGRHRFRVPNVMERPSLQGPSQLLAQRIVLTSRRDVSVIGAPSKNTKSKRQKVNGACPTLRRPAESRGSTCITTA